MSLQERIDRWISQGLASLMRKLLARSMGNAGPSAARRPQDPVSAIPLHRDPWCGKIRFT